LSAQIQRRKTRVRQEHEEEVEEMYHSEDLTHWGQLLALRRKRRGNEPKNVGSPSKVRAVLELQEQGNGNCSL
jgi:hypothetical protein